MHLAHNVLRTLRPLMNSVTRCKLGLKARFVARMEKERRWPKVVVLPQCSHFAMVVNPFRIQIVSAKVDFITHRIEFQPIRLN